MAPGTRFARGNLWSHDRLRVEHALSMTRMSALRSHEQRSVGQDAMLNGNDNFYYDGDANILAFARRVLVRSRSGRFARPRRDRNADWNATSAERARPVRKVGTGRAAAGERMPRRRARDGHGCGLLGREAVEWRLPPTRGCQRGSSAMIRSGASPEPKEELSDATVDRRARHGRGLVGCEPDARRAETRPDRSTASRI